MLFCATHFYWPSRLLAIALWRNLGRDGDSVTNDITVTVAVIHRYYPLPYYCLSLMLE